LSIREDILQNVKQLLAGIAATASAPGGGVYETTVDEVIDGDLLGIDQPAKNIVLGVFQRTYDVAANALAINNNDYPHTLQLAVRAWVRAEKDNLRLRKDQLQNDLMRALWADRYRGNTTDPVNTVRLSFTDENFGFEAAAGWATFMATVTVTWLGDARNP
jgi:hypothetical protein